MKKIFFFVLSLGLLGLLAFLFIQFQKIPEEKEIVEEKWHLEKISDVKIMSIKRNGLPISDIQWSLYLKKLNYESLPLSATFTLRNSVVLGDSQAVKCRIEYKNIIIEETLTNVETVAEGSFHRFSADFSYNLSELKKTTKMHEIKEFIKVFPSDPEIRYNFFISKSPSPK